MLPYAESDCESRTCNNNNHCNHKLKQYMFEYQLFQISLYHRKSNLKNKQKLKTENPCFDNKN